MNEDLLNNLYLPMYISKNYLVFENIRQTQILFCVLNTAKFLSKLTRKAIFEKSTRFLNHHS